MKQYILIIDEGTTGVKSLIYNRDMEVLGLAYRKLESIYPDKRMVEQDPEMIYEKTVETCREVVKNLNINPEEIACVGITNQRTSWLIWDRDTGKPLYNMVIWQDTRGVYQQAKFIADPVFNEKFPGVAPHLPPVYAPLLIDHIKDHNPEFKAAIERGNVYWGNVDAWLLYKFTKGKVFATSASTISNSTIYDNAGLDYGMPILEYVGIKRDMLPEVRDEYGDFGMMNADILGIEIPIYSMIADQQSAMFAQGCFNPDVAKCTNGTGTFLNANIGPEHKSYGNFYTSIAWRLNGKVSYMFEGSSFTAGTCLEWAKEQLELYQDVDQLTKDAESVPDNGGVYFVPALGGLTNPPFRDASARASFMGIGPSANRRHFVRAVLESVAYAAVCVFEEFRNQGVPINKLSVSGGVSKSDVAIQLMANLLDMEIARPHSVEASGLGAAELAAIHMGWIKLEEVESYLHVDKVFRPDQNQARDQENFKYWKKAADRSLSWLA